MGTTILGLKGKKMKTKAVKIRNLFNEIDKELCDKYGFDTLSGIIKFAATGSYYFGLVETVDGHFFIDTDGKIGSVDIYSGAKKAKQLFNDLKSLRG